MSLVVRYSLVGIAISAAFVNFISCGAQMYKASLDGDHQEVKEGQGQANSADPGSPEFGLHAPNGWTALPIVYHVEKGMDKIQLAAMQSAMSTWEKAVGKKLFTFSTTQNAPGSSFPGLYESLSDGVNGHYIEDSWKKTGKSDQVIATTIWNNYASDYRVISDSDIHYNSAVYYLSDALKKQPIDQREIVDMQSLSLHELGHLLGLAHVDAKVDSVSIMNPTLYIGAGLATRSLSEGDLKRIQKIYGCSGTACNIEATVQAINLAVNKETAAH